MDKSKFKKKSILWKLTSWIMVAVLLQAFLAAGILAATKVNATLIDYAFNLFVEKTSNRLLYLENDMLNRWSNISEYKNEILSVYNELLNDNSDLSESNKTKFLEKSSESLIEMLRYSMTTGGFIILDDSSDEAISNSCVYIISDNPVSSLSIKDNLQMIKGPIGISRNHKIPLSGSWSYGINLDEHNEDILKKPIAAAAVTAMETHQGFWHIAPAVKNDSNRNITYSLPLVDKNGRAFGVIGVEVSQEHLYKDLRFDEFAETGSYGYALASFNEQSREITPLLIQGTVQKSIFSVGEAVKLHEEDTKENCYQIKSTIGDIIISLDQIKVYSNNTPYNDSQLYLVGMVAGDNMTNFAKRLNQAIILVVVLITVVGLAISYFSAYRLASPIIKLYKKVQQNNPGTKVSLPRANIRELDDLAYAVEQLNENILASASSTDNILQMTGVGIGAFEYRIGGKFVKVSTLILDMFDLSHEEESPFSVLCDKFFKALVSLKQNPEEDFADTFRLSSNSVLEGDKWYKITEVEKEGNILGVVMEVTRDVLDRRALNYEIDYDKLTGIYNRLAFRKYSADVLSKPDVEIAAIAMFDLDNLKYINDTYGHEFGDFYIKESAKIIDSTFRDFAIVGRMSGDEFYVFFHGIDNKQNILNRIAELYQALENSPIVLPDSSHFKIRMSGGIAWYGDDSKNFDELIRYADFAMYEGKHTLKGELREFNKEKYLEKSYILVGKEELNRVLDNQFVEFVFQPIVSAVTGDIYGYESLMRPQSEILNTPMKLIQIAKSQSQLWKIERISFFKTMSTYMKYKDLFKDAKIFINSLPSEQLKDWECRNFENLYSDVLGNIVVEIIENEKTNVECLEYKLQAIARWNAKIALDDYGSGYSNDLNLINTHPSIVKLDKSLTDSVQTDKNRQAIIQKTLNFCRECDISVLAEGIETYEQMEYLVKVGVDFLQGYYISYPLSIPTYDGSKIKSEIENIHKTVEGAQQ